jgi:O-antigen ligase
MPGTVAPRDAASFTGQTAELGFHSPRLDVVWFLTCWLVLLYGLTARLILPGFGAIGQPATVIALMAGLWWIVGRFLPAMELDQRLQPIRIALLVHAGYLIASYGVGALRPLTSLERTGSTRAQIVLFALTGVGLLVADGIPDIERLRTLLRRLVTFAAAMAALALLQTVTGQTHHLVPPGLEWSTLTETAVGTRQGILRPLGTALHPIEFAVVTASLLPLALHFALHPRSKNDQRRAIVETGLLVLAIPASLSRSAVVCLIAAMGVLSLGWSWRRRFNALFVTLLGLPVVAALVPGVLPVMVELFTGADSDPSVQARIDRVPAIMAYITQRPWFGWGHGTYSVEEYLLIDNQLWVTTISSGIVGLLITILLLVVGCVVGLLVSHRPRATEEWGHMGRAIAAGIAAFAASTLTFTAFSYRILTFTLFLLIGCAGALWRLTGPPDPSDLTAPWLAGETRWGSASMPKP